MKQTATIIADAHRHKLKGNPDVDGSYFLDCDDSCGYIVFSLMDIKNRYRLYNYTRDFIYMARDVA